MKTNLFILGLAVAVAVLAIYSLQSSNPIPPPAAGAKKKPGIESKRKLSSVQVDAERGSYATPDRAPAPFGVQPDPREALLDALYQSPSVSDRLTSARRLAAQGTETSFRDLAMFIAAAAETGDESLLHLAGEVSGVLSRMNGPDIEAVATEFAYSQTLLVAEAAVNAAIAARQEEVQPIEGAVNVENQQELDDFAQRLQDSETSPGATK